MLRSRAGGPRTAEAAERRGARRAARRSEGKLGGDAPTVPDALRHDRHDPQEAAKGAHRDRDARTRARHRGAREALARLHRQLTAPLTTPQLTLLLSL